MRNLEEVQEVLAYHPGTADVTPRMAAIRRLSMSFVEEVWDMIPDGPEKTLAMRGIQTFQFHALCGLAMLTPADLITPEVARVMPGDTGDEVPVPIERSEPRPESDY